MLSSDLPSGIVFSKPVSWWWSAAASFISNMSPSLWSHVHPGSSRLMWSVVLFNPNNEKIIKKKRPALSNTCYSVNQSHHPLCDVWLLWYLIVWEIEESKAGEWTAAEPNQPLIVLTVELKTQQAAWQESRGSWELEGGGSIVSKWDRQRLYVTMTLV